MKLPLVVFSLLGLVSVNVLLPQTANAQEQGLFGLHSAASVFTDITRAEFSQQTQTNTAFQSRYSFLSDWQQFKLKNRGIAAIPGPYELIDVAAMGIRIGFKDKETGAENWNVGIAWMTDPKLEVGGLSHGDIASLNSGNQRNLRGDDHQRTGVGLLFSASF